MTMNTPATATPPTAVPEAPKPAPPPVKLGLIFTVAVVLIIIGLAVGLIPRFLAKRALVKETAENAVQTVETVSPGPGKTEMGVPLPAEVQAFVEAPIYARANGYLKRWDVDIGQHVEAGQLLAEIDTPEVDQQLAQARAEVAQADANLALAKSTSERWVDLLKTASVSEQETAEKKSDYILKQATVESARANVQRLNDLKSFDRVTAPFAGVVTARSTDIGQLIAAGSGPELFRLAQTDPLRVYVRVPQSLVHAIAPGQKAELTFQEMPGRNFEATVIRTAGAVDPASRTLQVELQVPNPRGEILSGSYAQVRLKENAAANVLVISDNALIFRAQGMQAAVVGADNKVQLHNLRLGRDFGNAVEVLSGLEATDRVILNPPDAIADGMLVQVAQPTGTNSVP